MSTQTSSDPSGERLSYVFSTLYKYKLLWILPAIAGMILAAVYAFALRPESWSARQSLIVRDDASGQSFKIGRFESLDSMKSAQETIFEIARKPQVIRNALEKLGPPGNGLLGMGGNGYPSEEMIEVMQGAISFSAPNGAEFGRTEVIILNTKESTRERSKQFIDLLVDEIIAKVDEVRRRKFQGMEVELSQTCSIAEEALEAAKSQLRENHKALGLDAVSSSAESSGDDPLKREIAQLNLEKRAVESEIASAQGVLSSLNAARENPNSIVNISSDLAKRQPQLDALKHELAAKKGLFAQQMGRYTLAHPSVKSARDAIVTVEKQIWQLLGGAIKDTRKYISIQDAKLNRLAGGIRDLETRLLAINESRADNMTLSYDVTKRSENLNKARSDLAEIQVLASARNADLLTKVDQSQVSTRPDGMGKRALVMCGGLGGLLFGMGVVMMFAPPMVPGNVQPADPSKPALADVGLESAKSGLNATANVIRDIITPKSKTGEREPTVKGASLDSSEHIQDRLSGIATKPIPDSNANMIESLNSKPEEPHRKLSDIQSAVSDAYSAHSPTSAAPGPTPATVEIPSVASSMPIKLVPQKINEVSKAAPDPGDLASQLRAAQEQKTLVKKTIPTTTPTEVTPIATTPNKTTPIETSPIETTPTEATVDRAFAAELGAKARPEAPTVDLSMIKSQIEKFDTPKPPSEGLDVSKPSAPSRGAQIKPRAANIRPVNLVQSEPSDEFVRNPVEPAAVEQNPVGEFKENPFLRDRVRKTKSQPTSIEEDATIVPVPEQIKKLSESIANFAKPITQQIDPKSMTEKF